MKSPFPFYDILILLYLFFIANNKNYWQKFHLTKVPVSKVSYVKISLDICFLWQSSLGRLLQNLALLRSFIYRNPRESFIMINFKSSETLNQNLHILGWSIKLASILSELQTFCLSWLGKMSVKFSKFWCFCQLSKFGFNL